MFKGNKMSSFQKRRERTAFLFMTPSLIVLFIFVFIPLVAAFACIRQITRLPKKVSPPDRGGES